jgi:hypothetical protein
MWSWLYSPAVALVSFVAALIAIGQLIASVLRYVNETTKDEAKRRFTHVGLASTSLAVMISVAVLSWSSIVTAASRSGSGGIIGETYPVSFDGLGIFSAVEFISAVLGKRRIPALGWCAFLASAISATCVYALGFEPGWRQITSIIFISAIPSVTMFLTMAMYWTRKHAESATISSPDPANVLRSY